jgi:hypothetical protein
MSLKYHAMKKYNWGGGNKTPSILNLIATA